MQEGTKATKAIILARVSSKDQEEGYSLEVQTDRLERYCLRKGMKILKKFNNLDRSEIRKWTSRTTASAAWSDLAHSTAP